MKVEADVLWIEDDEKVRTAWIPIFRSRNLRVHGVGSGKAGLSLFSAVKFSLIILDLKMAEMDGFQTLELIRRQNDQIPVFILSAFIEDPEYRVKLRNVSVTETIPKPLPMTTSQRSEEVIAKMKTTSFEYKAERFDPFEISFSDYLEMNDDQVNKLQKRAQEENNQWINHELNLRKAKWMLVCNRNIIKWSDSFEEYPTKEELVEIGQVQQSIPFVFFKPPTVEETRWSHLSNSSDFYPTIRLYAGQDKRMAKILADFDTGSSHTLFDYFELDKHKAVEIDCHFDFPFYEHHLGEEYRYYLKELIIQIIDDNNKQRVQTMHCFIVVNWLGSPYVIVNPQRVALAGRDILRKFSLVVHMDSKSNRTKVYHK